MSLSQWLIETAIHLIETGGYAGMAFALILDSCGIPIPSEVVLALSGSIARTTGEFNIFVVIIVGAVAQTIGALAAYTIGKYGGEPFVKKYGKYVLISAHDYDKTKLWFKKHGPKAIFISRLLPVIRTFSGFPAGTFGMDIKRFTIDTFAGSLLWSIIFASLGYAVGDSWRKYIDKLHYLDYIMLVVVIIFVIRYVYKKRKGINA